MNVNVFVVGSESGKLESFSGMNKISDVIEELQNRYPGKDYFMKYFDDRLDLTERLKDIAESDDETLELEAFEKADGDDGEEKPRDRSTLRNESDCRIVIQHKGRRTPTFLAPGDVPFEFKTSFFESMKAFIVFRDTQEEKDGESVFIGSCYHLSKDKKILHFKVTNTGVYKVMKTRDVIEIPAKGQTITAFEGDFQRPTRDDSLFGKSYPVDFKNKTGEKIVTVSGRSKSFLVLDLDPVVEKHDRATNIKIKPDKEGYRIGLTARKSLDKAGMFTYEADMFKVPKGIKLIEIEKSQGTNAVRRLIAVDTTGARSNPLQKDQTKTFREADKTFWRDVMIKAALVFGGAAITGAVGGAVGAGLTQLVGTFGVDGLVGVDVPVAEAQVGGDGLVGTEASTQPCLQDPVREGASVPEDATDCP